MKDQCRFCGHDLAETVADLGLSPVSNQFRPVATAGKLGQTFYPLKAMVCSHCWLVQLTEVEAPPHFTEDYVYFSSYSRSWLDHAASYAAQSIDRFTLGAESLVVELASNDGYLLQFFQSAGVRVLGIEPSGNTAAVARERHGIQTIVNFFGTEMAGQLARKGTKADLIVANNVLAHLPDPKDFIGGIPAILKPDGSATFEFPHLLRMIENCQFDTIYHEHFSYLSLLSVETMFAAFGLEVYGVEELSTHGGSLRVYAAHSGSGIGNDALAAGRDKVRDDELRAELANLTTYRSFASEVVKRKLDLLEFLMDAKRTGRKVAGYGAPAKGNTMLNYCGIGPELVAFTVDLSPHKQDSYLPGVNIEVKAPDALMVEKPDYILILPWNLREEIAAQLAPTRQWGAKFVVAIPEIQIF